VWLKDLGYLSCALLLGAPTLVCLKRFTIGGDSDLALEVGYSAYSECLVNGKKFVLSDEVGKAFPGSDAYLPLRSIYEGEVPKTLEVACKSPTGKWETRRLTAEKGFHVWFGD
jgi:hypothetical protein